MPARKAKKAQPKRKAAPKRPKGRPAAKDEGLFSVKRHASQGHILIAACDLELLGRTLEDGDVCLEVREAFYGGERVRSDILGRLLEMCTMANLVGKRCVSLAIKVGLVDKDCVIMIKGVPHAQALRF